ncbi:MAG: chemotaxis protein CheW, partial [Gemmatimonadota bacterium]
EGVISLSARRDRDAVIIEVRDDGRGVDEAAVRAQTGGVVPQEGEDLLGILATPGFSTARRVTAVSGRGVGIDAVMHWARRMGGVTGITTAVGCGTTFTLRIPLSVAIIPALLVRVADRRYALPLGAVAETVRIPLGNGRQTLAYQGGEVPLVDLGVAEGTGSWRPGVVLEVGGRRSALAVDTLLGQDDIVVGPLHAPRGMPAWINGATILADGQPALILDPTALVQGGVR